MPIYRYTARNQEGKIVQGQQEAVSETAAINQLQGSDLFVTQIVNTAFTVKSTKRIVKKRHQRINSEDLIFFIAQTANLLAVGIPFIRTLEVVSDQVDSERLYKTVQEMMSNVKAGSTFKDALARHPKVFPPYWTYLVEAGELSGTLPQVLTQLAKSMEAAENLKKKIVSALVYPAVLITASIGAVIVFMVFVIPVFANLFKSFNAKLPPLTLAILQFSNFLRDYYLFIVPAIAGAVYLTRKYVSSAAGRRTVQLLLLKLPIFGKTVSEITHARICMILAMLIRSGLSFLKSLDVTASVSGNYAFETALSHTKLDVQQGKTLSSSLAENALFSPMFVNLVKIGEESGKLPEMIEKAAEYFQARVDVFAARVGVLIEPLVMLFVGGIIGIIAVSMFLPMFRLSSAVK